MKLIKERIETFPIPKDPGKGKLKIRYLNAGQRQELLQDVNEVKYSVLEGKEEATVIPNGVELRRAVVIARIVDWENMFDNEGKKLECTDENKIAFSCMDGFMDILQVMINKLDKMVEADLKKERKNS